MKNLYLSLIILFSFVIVFINKTSAKSEASSFDSIYVEAATTMAALDIQKAIHVADSLYKSAENSIQEMKSLMLIATLKVRKGDKAEGLSHAIQAEKIAQKDKNYEWQIRIAGFLSTTFRDSNLKEEGKKYLAIAEQAIKKVNQDSPGLNVIQALMHQEKAYYKIAEEDYKAAIEELEEAEDKFLKIPEEQRTRTFLATTYQLLGNCLIGLKEYESAHEKLTLALNELGEQESELKAFIYTDFAEVEMHYGNYDSAYEFFKQAEVYLTTSDNFNLRSSLFKGLSNYYKAVGNQEEAIRYNEQYTDYVKAYSSSTRDISNQLIQQLRLEKEKAAKRNYLLIGASLFLLLVIGFLVLLFRNTRKREKIKYEGIIKRIETSEPLFKTVKRSFNQNNGRESLMMPKETEERILTELNKLEEATFFIQKDISLSSLATSLQTNPKYLSYVINTHKGKDFNNYINELRISFVIDRLHNHPEYLDYKLSYIAEECGFSSHSKFAAVFKNITQLSPSTFISHLKKDIREEVES